MFFFVKWYENFNQNQEPVKNQSRTDQEPVKKLMSKTGNTHFWVFLHQQLLSIFLIKHF